MPKISIITINYNNKTGLEKTIESVINQSFREFEYIIIDGGSTDGSKEVIEKYSNKITYWVSEADAGIYNAMNKGLKRAEGKYCLFLNSGDYFLNKNSLNILIANTDDIDIVFGNLLLVDSENKNVEQKYPDELTFSYFLNNSLPHQASLIKTKLLIESCGYDEQYTIISDWAFFVHAIFNTQCSYKNINEIITVFKTDGISHEASSTPIIKKERYTFYKQHFSLIIDEYLELVNIKNRYELLKTSRLRKILALIFPQLRF